MYIFGSLLFFVGPQTLSKAVRRIDLIPLINFASPLSTTHRTSGEARGSKRFECSMTQVQRKRRRK
jgi:hypothetical protein